MQAQAEKYFHPMEVFHALCDVKLGDKHENSL